MVCQKFDDYALKRIVVLDASVLPIRVLHSILICSVSGDLRRYLLSNNLADLVCVLPVDVAEQVIECFEDVGKSIQLWLQHPATIFSWHRIDLGVLVRQGNL